MQLPSIGHVGKSCAAKSAFVLFVLGVCIAPQSSFGAPSTSHGHTASMAAPHPLVPLLLCVPVQVIASNDINDEMNQLDVPVFWPERKYPWGTAQAFNPDHSDLFFLRWDQPIAQVSVKMHLWGGLFEWCGCVQLPCLTLAMQYCFNYLKPLAVQLGLHVLVGGRPGQ
jgi:hypothetical protein